MTDKRIVLHIGASKTGSSAIQQFLRANQDFFRANGFVIPDRLLKLSSKVTGEHVLALQALISDPDESRLTEAFRYLRAETDPDRAILLSAENLSNLGNHRRFAAALDGFEAKAVLYIRRQDDLLQSAWQQWHSKIHQDFNAWLLGALRQYGHWDRVIANWESILGEGNVTVRIFERGAMAGGDLYRDFLDALGLDPATDVPEFDLGPVNPSYSDVITPLVAGNRGIFQDTHDHRFYTMIGELTGDTYVDKRKVSLMSREQRDAVVSFYSDINKRVCDRFFPQRPLLFSAVEHARYQYLTPEETLHRQLQFLTDMMFRLAQKQGCVR